MEPVEGAAEIVRQLTDRPSQQLTRRAGARPLFRFEGGAYTADDFHRFMSDQGPPFRAQVRDASNIQLIGLLGNLAQGKVLVSEAEQAGISLSEAEQDSMLAVARTRFTRAASDLELTSLVPPEGVSTRDYVEEGVREVMRRILDGDENIPPLGHLSYVLRDAYRADVYAHNFTPVLERTSEFRVIRGRSRPMEPPDSPAVAPNAPPPGN